MHLPHVTAALSLVLWAAGPSHTFSLLSSIRPITPTTRGPASRDNFRHGSQSTRLFLTPLPKDISPFDKSASKGRDIQGDLRKLATTAIERAFSSKEPPTLLELEFPPLIGGEQSKTQFDDFDNVQELNQNRDWCVQWLPTLSNEAFNNQKDIWFILPDTKEVELCKEEWKGDLYRNAAVFSSIESVAQHYFSAGGSSNGGGEGYSKPWGA